MNEFVLKQIKTFVNIKLTLTEFYRPLSCSFFFVEKMPFRRYENEIKNIDRIISFPNLYMIFIMIRIRVLH